MQSNYHYRFGDRLRVVAIRFEGLDGRWLCTLSNTYLKLSSASVATFVTSSLNHMDMVHFEILRQ